MQNIEYTFWHVLGKPNNEIGILVKSAVYKIPYKA